MSRKPWKTLRDRMSPEARARVESRVTKTLESMPLAEIRKAVGLTQEQLADELEIGQSSVSKLEHATDMYISTLRRFVQALGGELVIRASFPDGRELVIDNLSDLPKAG